MKSNEKKIKAIGLNGIKLPDKELEQVAGGNPNGAVAHDVPLNTEYNEDIHKCPVCGASMSPIAVRIVSCTNDPKFLLTASFHVNHGGKQIEKWIVTSNDNS